MSGGGTDTKVEVTVDQNGAITIIVNSWQRWCFTTHKYGRCTFAPKYWFMVAPSAQPPGPQAQSNKIIRLTKDGWSREIPNWDMAQSMIAHMEQPMLGHILCFYRFFLPTLVCRVAAIQTLIFAKSNHICFADKKFLDSLIGVGYLKFAGNFFPR